MNTIAARQDNKTARKLISLIEEFRKLDPEIQAQQIVLFLSVVGSPEITMKELEQRTGLASSTISRNMSSLGKMHRNGKPGHDLIAAYEDPADRRFKRVKPTPKGIRVYNSLIELLAR
ncbi:MAG: hypothetical protein ACTHJ3_02600 [Pararhizobium sp.]